MKPFQGSVCLPSVVADNLVNEYVCALIAAGKDWGRITGVIFAAHVATTMVLCLPTLTWLFSVRLVIL